MIALFLSSHTTHTCATHTHSLSHTSLALSLPQRAPSSRSAPRERVLSRTAAASWEAGDVSHHDDDDDDDDDGKPY